MSHGLVDESWWRGRQDAYLQEATRVVIPESPLNLVEHLERRRRDPDHPVVLDRVDDEVLEVWFDRIDHWKDCADFDVVRLLTLLHGYRDELPDRIVEPIERRLAGFTYWYTEPHPPGVVDQRWYWSENHRLLFHAVEHLAGQALPEATFADGRTGAAHRHQATARLHAWFDEKAELGFSEWHSDVYYEKDLAPLISLVEWTDDPALAERAAAFCDLFLLDLALHQRAGNTGCTHGRSYMKDKSRAVEQPVFAAVKLCFDTTWEDWIVDPDESPYAARNEGAALLARARRYRPPEVIRRIATSTETMEDREHHGLPIDPEEPFSDDPRRADGRSWTDPELVPFWWDRSALTPWQHIGVTVDTLEHYGLWDADLFAAFRLVRDATGGDREVIRRLAHDLAPVVNAGLLAEVDTITWRSAHALLSSAQSYRPGRTGYQHHVWQATLDEEAVVFTTHPANEPWPKGVRRVGPGTAGGLTGGTGGWADGDRWWTGSATLPRAVQHGPAVIVAYSPAFDPPDFEALAAFGYLPLTHAFFPTERFDEVVERDGWVCGRRGAGYVGLWSWRPTRWRDHDPDEVETGGLRERHDLVAEGGAADVWVCEVGDADRSGTFDSFIDDLVGSTPTVLDRGPAPEGGHAGFDVTWTSPGAGHLELGPTGPLRVDGTEVPVGGHPRMANPWVTVEQGSPVFEVRDGEWSLTLDLAEGRRRAGGPDPLRGPLPGAP